jgi:hypothetical protein
VVLVCVVGVVDVPVVLGAPDPDGVVPPVPPPLEPAGRLVGVVVGPPAGAAVGVPLEAVVAFGDWALAAVACDVTREEAGWVIPVLVCRVVLVAAPVERAGEDVVVNPAVVEAMAGGWACR